MLLMLRLLLLMLLMIMPMRILPLLMLPMMMLMMITKPAKLKRQSVAQTQTCQRRCVLNGGITSRSQYPLTKQENDQ